MFEKIADIVFTEKDANALGNALDAEHADLIAL